MGWRNSTGPEFLGADIMTWCPRRPTGSPNHPVGRRAPIFLKGENMKLIEQIKQMERMSNTGTWMAILFAEVVLAAVAIYYF